ncbi:MarR family winged helix-turn-helix transcriptional regulator [Bradyrhizobium sp.]|uniref:MarR family winged helix-turn-helix transcriptional regulator n=1 Tax=Bradyrhizobium sp. TaxID=376 RepID=UPI002D1FBA89|nr:MarR family winged helix-turn-helix transcriptional regulator [Bradyrhizobium sp.]
MSPFFLPLQNGEKPTTRAVAQLRCGQRMKRPTAQGSTFSPVRSMSSRQAASVKSVKDVAFRLKHPEEIDDFLAFRLYNLSKLAARGAGIMFRRALGITRRDWRILAYVGQHPDRSLTELGEIADLDQVVLSRGVAKLVERSLIMKARLSSNKRLLVLRLTVAGQAVYEQARENGKKYNAKFASCLTDQEAELLETLLGKLERRAGDLTNDEIAKGGNAEEEVP